MADFYTDIERSIQQTLLVGMSKAGLKFPIYNNMISKADFKNTHGAINIMNLSDVPTFMNGGGVGAYIKTPEYTPAIAPGPGGYGDSYGAKGYGGKTPILSYDVTPWPYCYDLMYGIEVQCDRLNVLRSLNQLVRDTFSPRGVLYLWDSTANGNAGGFTTQYADLHYAGYANRDNPAEEMYWRVTNIRFEAFNFNTPSVQEPSLTQLPVLTIDTTQGS